MMQRKQKNFTFIDLFSGIGGMRIPFDRFNGECVFSSEIDLACQKMYFANFGERPFGDITLIDPKDIPNHDILLGGFPCQAFSIIGSKKGFMDTRGTLFFNIESILQRKMPKAFLLENVKQLSTHDGGNTFAVIKSSLRALGYNIHTTILNSLHFGVPQKRERTYIVGFLDNIPFKFPSGKENYNLANVLENDEEVDSKYFASDYIVKRRMQSIKDKKFVTPSIWHENKGGNISALPYSCALRAYASYNYLLVNGRRRLTEREMLRLQGFPEKFKIAVDYTQLRIQAGNTVTVPVIHRIAQEMLESMNLIENKFENDVTPGRFSFQHQLYDHENLNAFALG